MIPPHELIFKEEVATLIKGRGRLKS